MARIKGGTTTRRKHKQVLKLAKGYWMSRGKQIKKAKEAILHAGEYAYAGRKQKKRAFRQLWIIRLNAALHISGMSYNKFINSLKTKNIGLDRKVLSQIATEYPKVFDQIVQKVTQQS